MNIFSAGQARENGTQLKTGVARANRPYTRAYIVKGDRPSQRSVEEKTESKIRTTNHLSWARYYGRGDDGSNRFIITHRNSFSCCYY